jgi:uncharacterized membrane protein YfcA
MQPEMGDLYFYLLIGILVFFGFTVRVVTGFGSALMVVPLVSLLMEPKDAVVFSILLECAIGAVFLLKERLNFAVIPIFAGGIIGILAGIILFGFVTQRLVGFIIGLSVLIFSVIFLMNITFRTKREGALFSTLGFLSGSMGVLTGINGPQIVLGLVNQGYDAPFIRSCMISYLIVIDFVTLASFSIAGYLTTNVLILLLWSVPFLICSYAVGTALLKFIDPERLKRLMLLITLFAGILAIWKFVPLGVFLIHPVA